MAIAELVEANTVVSVRIGHRDGSPMTLAELHDVVTDLRCRGYSDDVLVHGTSSLSLFQQLPVMTPSQVRTLVGEGS